MSELDQVDDLDFALVAYREDGEWVLDDLTPEHLEDVPTLVHALRRLPGDAGALALVGVDESWFLLLRVTSDTARLVLSDVTAAEEWELADGALGFLRLPEPEDDDDPVPAGDLDLLADLGMGATELAELIDDDDLYPDEVLSDVAERLGFGGLFDDAVGLASA